jgi:hypothetical protein
MVVSILVCLGMALAGLAGFLSERASRDRSWARCPLSEAGACACKMRSAQMKTVCPRGALVRAPGRG